ncbi:putative germin, rmlC-like cupin domain superfamily, rmlC-like jelly roll [Helianthus annuus]|nr:putative germin, rmlC-like cupin domain superfamily, rmlC-like jelly roll [Helianthus annuus]KAJ0894372.1 putative germin, rmlC-like cupin domain superfamily, rmlC-like jelly roll [Helianthus annuus]
MASNPLSSVLLITSIFLAVVQADELLCVANLSLPANADGFYSCKDPKFITVNDFSFSRLLIPPTTKNNRGRISTRVYDRQLPGLNKVGASILLFDFASGDFVTPHIHHHVTEILVILRGSILVNLNMSAPENYHFTKVVRKGDVFVIPQGWYHSVKNVGKTDAMIFTTFNQQHPDV